MDDIESGAADPDLRFLGKFKLSMLLTPHRHYWSRDSAVSIVTLTTDPAKAVVFALYAVTNAGRNDVCMLQMTPTQADQAVYPGFVSVMGKADDVAAMAGFEYRGATQFIAEFSGPAGASTVRLLHRDSERYLIARVGIDKRPTLWLPERGSMFASASWQLETVQAWNMQTMANADLRYVLGLRNLCRNGLSFAGARLEKAEFSRAMLDGCNFTGANCEGAYFVNASAIDADFTRTGLKDAYFSGADLRGAKLPDAVFSKTSFDPLYGARPTRLEGATLTKASFKECDLSGAKFNKAKLAGANLADTNLSDADFTSADLTGAQLTKATLKGTLLKSATLTRASFENAVFAEVTGAVKPVDFTEATLYEIDFSGCDLRRASFTGRPKFHEKADAKLDATTRRASLCRARIPLALIGKASWRMLDLTGATIDGKLATLKDFDGQYTIFPEDCDFSGMDVTGAKFNHARMVRMNMSKVESSADTADPATIPDFSNADLTAAIMPDADLGNANFTKAVMHGINLSGAYLSGALFTGVRLDTIDDKKGKSLIADLSYATLVSAAFDGAYLDNGTQSQGANFSYVKFHGEKATITNATLAGAVFSNAYLGGLDFTGGNSKAMEDVNFAGACLLNCVFKKASLKNAVLTGACLLGADFTDADLSGAKMTESMIADDPVPFKSPATSGNVLTVTGVFASPRELEYGRTKIVEKATNRETICPSKANGPCTEPMWNRVRGKQKWPDKRKE